MLFTFLKLVKILDSVFGLSIMSKLLGFFHLGIWDVLFAWKIPTLH